MKPVLEVEASSLRDAHQQACERILSYGGPTSERFCSSDIEFIEDAAGESHYPQFYLPRKDG